MLLLTAPCRKASQRAQSAAATDWPALPVCREGPLGQLDGLRVLPLEVERAAEAIERLGALLAFAGLLKSCTRRVPISSGERGLAGSQVV